MGTHDLSQHGPGGGMGNGTINASLYTKRPSDVRSCFRREELGSFQDHVRGPQSFSHSEVVSVGAAEGPENYYTSLLQASRSKSQNRQDIADGIGSSRHKTALSTLDHAEPSLRAILSDPLTGELMEDATILPCGHSFGSGGLRRVLETNACISCGVPVSQDLLAPNFALQAAVQAFKREEELWKPLSRKKRRERLEHDQLALSDQASPDALRLKGVQFPFVVGDRVMIKGNKRTPDRFVGREALITTQCLNGWYMVKTLDNGETVKLQYRSLTKVGGQQSQVRNANSQLAIAYR